MEFRRKRQGRHMYVYHEEGEARRGEVKSKGTVEMGCLNAKMYENEIK